MFRYIFALWFAQFSGAIAYQYFMAPLTTVEEQHIKLNQNKDTWLWKGYDIGDMKNNQPLRGWPQGDPILPPCGQMGRASAMQGSPVHRGAGREEKTHISVQGYQPQTLNYD